MFLVTKVLRRLPLRKVELTALNDVSGVHKKLLMWRHSSEIRDYPYRFASGSAYAISFAPWRRLMPGDQISDTEVLQNPSMQRLIERGCDSPTSEKWTITRRS
jgi:hypothetical protein